MRHTLCGHRCLTSGILQVKRPPFVKETYTLSQSFSAFVLPFACSTLVTSFTSFSQLNEGSRNVREWSGCPFVALLVRDFFLVVLDSVTCTSSSASSGETARFRLPRPVLAGAGFAFARPVEERPEALLPGGSGVPPTDLWYAATASAAVSLGSVSDFSD